MKHNAIMSTDAKPISIQILDKEFRVSCREQERDALFEAARFLDTKMKEIRGNHKVVGTDRIAVMAALNIAHDLLKTKSQEQGDKENVDHRIKDMQEKIDVALFNNKLFKFSDTAP